jgi:hypothetical protein
LHLGADEFWGLTTFGGVMKMPVPSEFEPAWEINATTRNVGGKNKKNVPQGDYDVLCIRTGLL